MTDERRRTRRFSAVFGLLLAALLVGLLVGAVEAQPKPEGEMRWALYVTVAPAWLDPGEVLGFITPFWVQYALHDALVKPMPGNIMTPSLAESWTLSPDQKTYHFKLRQGPKVHHPVPRRRRPPHLPARQEPANPQAKGAHPRNRRSVSPPVPPSGAVPRLHGL